MPHIVTSDDLHQWRRSRKLKQKRLAELLGVTPTTVCNWEAGRTRTPINLAERLEKLAYDLAPRPQPKAPDYIHHENSPHLYAELTHGHKRVHVWRGTHPKELIENGFLDPLACGVDIADIDPDTRQVKSNRIPFKVLQNPLYLDAVKRWKASGRYHPYP